MIHLHVHTKYSLLDGMMHIEDIATRLKEIGQDTIAITEHGNLYSNVEAYSKLSKEGIKVINGCEVYICKDVNVQDKNNRYNHLILLSKNEQGRTNLNWLVTQSTLHKYYGKPRIDFDMLKTHSEGLICLSACMAGEVSRALLNNNYELAKTVALKYKGLFGDDYYIEYQAHNVPEQQSLNVELVHLAQDIGVKYVVTADAHYTKAEDEKYHSIFIQIGSNREVGEVYKDCYLQTEEEVYQNCKSTNEYTSIAIQTTQEIADKCENTIPLSAPIIPHVPYPAPYKSEVEYLKFLCADGLKKKGFMTWNLDQWNNYMTDKLYNDDGTYTTVKLVEFNSVKEIQQKYIDRALYEMNALEEMGFAGYYLLVHSYANAAKRRGIARGSGGGSLLAYFCGIVDIDPIKYGLYFERFIDVGALNLLKDGTITKKELKIPDFDLDFAPKDRENVLQFVIDKYGADNVVSLGQFSYIWAKGAIKDIGKVLGIPFETTNEITKNLDNETIEEALNNGVLDDYKNTYPQLFEYAMRLSGLPKSFGVHPCGKVITIQPAIYYNATEWNEGKNTWVLQGDMHSADDLGLVKADFLGLRTLDVIYDTLAMIGKDYNYIAPHKINMNDKQVWNEFGNGNTDCIFQFESSGMKHMLQDMKCNSMENLSAANALYRPGSKIYIPNYVNRKNGVEEITYLHPDLKPILEKSYGIIVFQEQLIEIGKLAGLRNPDELRKATAKKKPKLMAKIEPELKNGLMSKGWAQNQVDELWETILLFAKYSFNRSHSAAYALTAYITMFLKVHHTAEFFTACINSYEGDSDNIVKTIKEAERMGVKIKYDDWQSIKGKTTCRNGVVYLGINTLKGFGSNVADGLSEIGQSNCNSFGELVKMIDANPNISKSQFTALIKLGYFNSFGKPAKLLQYINYYNEYANKNSISKEKTYSLPLDKLSHYCAIRPTTYKKNGKVDKSEDSYKSFTGFRGEDLLNDLWLVIPNKDLNIKEVIEAQKEYTGTISYINNAVPNDVYIVEEITFYANKSKPYLSLYNLNNGSTLKTRITDANLYEQAPIKQYNVIKVLDTYEKPKSKMIDGKWVKSETETDTILSCYETIA